MTNWIDSLPPDACEEALEWCRRQPDLETAWRRCTRGDWMLWLIGRYSGEPGSDGRKRLVRCACDCAELSAHHATSDGQMAIALCLTIARDWATGGESDLEDVEAAASDAAYAAAAADAAYAAAYAAYAAAYAAYAAAAAASDAAYAAYAAADAAYAAAYAAYAAARAATLATCADIVREHYPEPPITP